MPQRELAVIGGGPAGLRAAEVGVRAGLRVTIYDGKPSVGRKFLVAGKSGLNLTNVMSPAVFPNQYSGEGLVSGEWARYLDAFGPDDLRKWAMDLGVDTFEASSGKVFPVGKKAAPLLRRWVLRLRAEGVHFAMNHRWVGLDPRTAGSGFGLHFQCPEGEVRVLTDVIIFALGGASWPQTGSDGGWVPLFEDLGIPVTPLAAANCGWEFALPAETLARVDGAPLHNLRVRAGGREIQGELMLTRYGVEGTPVYTLGPILRKAGKPIIEVDFKPSFTVAQLVQKMESVRRGFLAEAEVRWKLPRAAGLLVKHFYGEPPSAEALATWVKACRIPLSKPRPIEEAISTAGGVAWAALDKHLMLRRLPGVFCAGEMLAWEAPTGGFLLQGCFATGTVAGEAAVGHPLT